jgi:hypothetical protein
MRGGATSTALYGTKTNITHIALEWKKIPWNRPCCETKTISQK